MNPRRQRQRDLCPLGEHSVLVPQVLSAHGSNLYKVDIFPDSVSYPMYIDNSFCYIIWLIILYTPAIYVRVSSMCRRAFAYSRVTRVFANGVICTGSGRARIQTTISIWISWISSWTLTNRNHMNLQNALSRLVVLQYYLYSDYNSRTIPCK